MARADISKLWQLEEIAAAGHHDLAANLRTAINELVRARTEIAESLAAMSQALDESATLAGEVRDLRQALTGRTVSCEACNGMQPVYDAAMKWFKSDAIRGLEWSRLLTACDNAAARRATDENGGLA